MVHWSPFVMSFKKKYPWIQLAGHAGSCCSPGLSDGMSSSRGAGVGRGPACVEGALALDALEDAHREIRWSSVTTTLER